MLIQWTKIFFSWLDSPSGPRIPHFLVSPITFRHSTLGRTPMNQWSARRRDLYRTTHNTHNRQTSIPPAGFESTIPATERPQTQVARPLGMAESIHTVNKRADLMWFWPWIVVNMCCSILQTGHITLSSTPDQQLENHSTKYHRQQPPYNTLEFLMMGIVVPETCWASIKICNENLCCI